MQKSNLISPQKYYKLAPVSLSIYYILSILICSLGIATDTSSFFKNKNLEPEHFNQPTLNLEQIKQVVKTQNATIVQYSILYDEITVNGEKQNQESRLLTWVIKPNGEVSMRQVNLQARRCKQRFSFIKIIQRQQSCLHTIKDEQNLNKQQFHLQELHQILIEPIADLLPKQSQERVIFIPQGNLFMVPFTALQDNQGKYLIEKYAISTAPSIQLLDLLYQRKTKRQIEQSSSRTNTRGDKFLIVGNPTMPKIPPKPGENPLQLLPIPGAEQEAKTIAKIFKTQAITGDAATETAIVQKMPQAKIIHLATHAIELNNSNALAEGFGGAIALATSTKDDGWLSIAEIQKLPLQADLVVLSAANTALGRITGDGVIGLSRAFFVAGADSVIGSLWEVGDESTSFLMVKFYENFSKNPNKASAFRKAILETMKKYPNPQDWAGFTSIGLL